jgi:type VI secretion system secreted protein Hcp
MAYDAFLKLDGIDGESQKDGHEGEIDILSFSWGAANPTSMGGGSGSGTGKVSIHDFSVVKATDKSSASLFLKCCNGTNIATAKVTLRKAAGDAPIEYLVYNFTNVFVSSIQWSGSGGGGDDVPMESASFSFETCEINYTPQKDDGTPDSPQTVGWDVSANKKK